MYPVNMPHVIQKCFDYGQSDRICLIELSTSNLVDALPGSYISNNSNMNHGWPGQVLAKQIWSRSKPACKNYSAQLNFVSEDGKVTLGH